MSIDHRLINESLFIQAFNYAPIGMVLVAANGIFLKANPAICSMLGYSESELKNITFQEITHPEDLELDILFMTELLAYKRDSYQMEKRYIHKNGHIVWAILAVSLVHDDEDATQFFISQIINITDQKHMEISLREKERLLHERDLHYRSIVNHSFDFISIHNPDGTYQDLSASYYEVLGYSSEEMIGKPGLTFVHPDDVHKGTQDYEAVLQTGKLPNLVYRIRKKNGEYLCLEAISITITDPNTDEIIKIIVVSRDITERMRMIKTLEETQELYRIISDNAQDIITFASPDGVTRYISPAVRNLLGYEMEELLGIQWTDVWHPEDLADFTQMGIFQDSDVDIFKCRVRHKQGHYVWFETTVKIIRNEKGEIAQVLGVGRDITKRKQAEDELCTTQERLESFIKNNGDAIWVVDRDGKVKEANAAFEKMFQWHSQELINQTMPIIPEHLRQQSFALCEQVLSGHSVIGYETIRLCKDGTLIDVSTTLSPIRDTMGHIIGIAGICRDITEKKQAEQSLKATKEQLESYIDHNVDSVLILNLEYKVVRVNHAFEITFGWSSSEIVGTNVFDLPLIPNDLKPGVVLALERMQPYSVETVRRKKGGDEIPVMVSLFTIQDEARNPNGWAVTLRDITANKNAEELLINSEKLSVAGQLAAGIAHEIRNPITAIKGFMQLLKSGYSEKQLYYDIMSSEIERIEMILSELLILAKPQLVHSERKDIRILLAQVTTLLDTHAIINNVQIVTEFEPGITHILCDENQLKQVCINFIKNAIEAMPQGGTVVIQLKSKSEDTILLRFIDHGCGIPEHILSKLGQPFYTTKEKGTGLGFMVSKKIIENHNGTVNVFSKENEGTTIEVRLPTAY
ncbi:PAS domain S-box-containing protein [Paenibacillus sp. yr247]|uniref:PAS domain S-box protein n=1 Tax=Paenibacillus sp. yr247 TaxID=1761880 RepID=UPI00088C4B5E|nr:PAS domain S-box protein [Paenibacillus sp. yr247]SDN70071.1 PAS domain S-box-containing protein [Paenibacillus sp. yr247]